jgi:hypothetical protein
MERRDNQQCRRLKLLAARESWIAQRVRKGLVKISMFSIFGWLTDGGKRWKDERMTINSTAGENLPFRKA